MRVSERERKRSHVGDVMLPWCCITSSSYISKTVKKDHGNTKQDDSVKGNSVLILVVKEWTLLKQHASMPGCLQCRCTAEHRTS